MKKINGILATLAMVAGVCVAQTADYTIRQVRDPIQFTDALNADITTITGRLVAAEVAIPRAAGWAAVSNTVQAGAALGATAVQPGSARVTAGLTIVSGAYTGVVNIVGTALTMVVNGTVTNVIHADITSE